MSIKKITAPSMPEAFQRVKEEVGEEAVILSSRVVWTGGILGFFKRKQFEVIAVMDDDIQMTGIAAGPNLSEINRIEETKKDDYENTILSELTELKKMVATERTPSDQKISIFPEAVQKVVGRLLDQEVENSRAMNIGEQLLQKWRHAQQEPSEIELVQEAKEILVSELDILHFSKPLHKKFVALVGPTGVGKTTTLAKLAAHAVLEEKKKVAFITLDTYRIAAIEQLKTYAGLLDVPVEVAYEPEDFIKAAEVFADCDHIFIDTAGRNYRDAEFVHALNKMLSQKDELEILLALAVTMKEKDIDPIMENFKMLPIDQLIFTKADETKLHGSMVNIMLKHNLPAAYITTGQDVPDDIIHARPDLFSEYIFGVGSE
ncbi:GTP-binding signal recognition particle SRP54 G-domain-containing protein [Bacillus freudenreichii]|nr:GTP-binding signal recognition particle SRP54 G-domain-containing protein [Bacillus freudenreichii]